MTRAYTIGEAKTQLSKLVREVEQGQTVILCRGKHPVVRLVGIPSEKTERRPGRMKGRVRVTDDFDEWPEDVARALGIVD